MTYSLDDRIEDYLNGNLSEEDTIDFESDLQKEDVAIAFRAALFMRELLRDIPPDDPPPDLIGKIEASLSLETMQTHEEPVKGEMSGYSWILSVFKLGLIWPKYTFKSFSGDRNAIKDSLSGIRAVIDSIGSLRESARRQIMSIRLPEKPLWKTVLSKLW